MGMPMMAAIGIGTDGKKRCWRGARVHPRMGWLSSHREIPGLMEFLQKVRVLQATKNQLANKQAVA